MDYIQLSFPVAGSAREILIARLTEAGCEGFEETDELLNAYIPAPDFDEPLMQRLSAESSVTFTQARIPQQNWNATWEAGFEPIVIPGFCTVRAAFHQPATDTPYEVIITPKMSFGTGHHATTRLMMESIRSEELRGKRVLDFGTGTGILAILAQKLGADSILAIDNDEWSVENAGENIAANGAGDIRVLQGSLEAAGSSPFDLILANINRHILLQDMAQLKALLAAGGALLVSGILEADEPIITEAASAAHLFKDYVRQEGAWLAIRFLT